MGAEDVLRIVLLAAATVVCGFAAYALFETVRTLRAARSFVDRTGQRLVPLLEKADVTADAVNAELLRVDGIVTRFEEVSQRVDHTSHTVHDVVNAPIEAVASLGSRVARLLAARRRRRERAHECVVTDEGDQAAAIVRADRRSHV